MNIVPLENLTLAHFSALVNGSFRVYSDPATMLVELKLVAASPARRGADASAVGPDTRNFSIVFTGPGDLFLPQRTYAFEHDQIGRFILFIVPIGKERDRFRYEAVFNRRAET